MYTKWTALALMFDLSASIYRSNSYYLTTTPSTLLLLLLLFITHKNVAQIHTSYKYSMQVKQTNKEKCNQRIKPQ